ncbi:DUF11 domain-containing protein [Candidatus Saccharibacteria bacterium]|nr:DUF11 domain-containing protein [Candidatus Saccharibacteria bacterium]
MLKTKNIKFKRRAMIAGFVATAVAAIVPYASSSAWGPERTTFTVKEPADYITFNSITDNTAIGDERNFVRIREAGSTDPYRDSVAVTPGKEYEVYIYFHNDGKSSLNGTGKGVATGTKIRTELSDQKVNSSKKVKVSAVLKANNSNPLEVWDEAYLTSTSKYDVSLRYVAGSATIHNGWKANGSPLSGDSLFSNDGALIGENVLDGTIPACAEFSGYVTYRIRADQAASKVSKTVSKDGKSFFETVDVQPGDKLTYKVDFENTGTLDLTSVTFHDKLPAGVTLVPGTTVLKNITKNTETKMPDVIGQNGFSIGTYGPGTKASITYQVKVNADVTNDLECNKSKTLKNTVYAVYGVGTTDRGGEVYDSSTIKVAKTCNDNPPDDTPKCEDGDKECICKEDPSNPICDDSECKDDDKDCICKENPNDPICDTPDTPKTPDDPDLPKTGPGEIALAIVAVVCIATGGIYWYRSQKEVAKIQNNVEGKDAEGGADPNASK